MASSDQVKQLIQQWESSLQQGQPVPIAVLCAECPELIRDIELEIAAMTTERNQVSETVAQNSPAGARLTARMNRASDDEYIFDVSSYSQLEKIAEGGLGQIFTAVDQELNRHVALKFIKPQHDLPDKRAQFALEGEITARLEHPGIVPLYGKGATSDGRPFQVMRLIRGESFLVAIADHHRQLAERGSTRQSIVRFRNLLARFVTTCQTIAYAHSRGIVHRDLKPDNIMLGKYGETLVVDWGLAIPVERRAKDRDTGEKTLLLNPSDTQKSSSLSGVAGSPAYMSPEQASASPNVGPSADIYGLGATLYELLTGHPPRTGDNVQTVLSQAQAGTFAPPRRVLKSVPKPLEAICLKAMQTDPEARYESALDLANDTERWLADEPVSVYRESLRERLIRWTINHQGITQAIVLGFLLLLISGVIWSTSTFMLRRRLIEQRVQSLISEANLNERLVTGAFADLKQDVVLLAHRPQVIAGAERFAAGEAASDLAELASEFEAFMGLNPAYMQARLIDHEGFEKIRIDRSEPGENPYPVEGLQFKGKRDYFLETRELADGEVFLSNIDINVEQNQHQWDMPVVRAAVPIFSKSGTDFLGIVIINMHFDYVVDLIHTTQAKQGVLTWITNDQGNFLFFPGADDVEFCFERGLEYPIEAVYPKLENFRRSSKAEMEPVATRPLRSLLVVAGSNEPAASREFKSTLEDIVESPEFREFKLRTTKYLPADKGRAMAVLIGNPRQPLDRLTARLSQALGPDARLLELPDENPGAQHEVYARKIFFDPRHQERFICLVVAVSHSP